MRIAWMIGMLAACGGDDPFESDGQIASWANASSALGAYTYGYEPIGFADGKHMFGDPACPTHSDDGTTVTLGGDCTDVMGHQWFGTATIVRGADNRRDLMLDAFGNDAFGGASKVTGTVVVTEMAADRHAFEVDVTARGGITNVVRYSGTVVGTYDTATTWNGTGSISRDGDYFDGGSIDATTVDQLRDNSICAGEGISGTTTMKSPEHTIVITYDGASDCDDDDGALWSKDGDPKGVVKGVTCNAGGTPGLTLAVVFVALRRRRRR